MMSNPFHDQSSREMPLHLMKPSLEAPGSVVTPANSVCGRTHRSGRLIGVQPGSVGVGREGTEGSRVGVLKPEIDAVRRRVTAVDERREDALDVSGRITLNNFTRIQAWTGAREALELTLEDIAREGLLHQTSFLDIPDVNRYSKSRNILRRVDNTRAKGT